MQRSSGDRGYVEPLAALAAVFALAVGVTLYAGTLAETSPTPDRERATAMLDAVAGNAEVLGLLNPADIEIPDTPAGWSVNLTLEAGSSRWTRGGPPSPTADRASRRVSVRTGPGIVEPGRLRVAVW